MQSLLEFTTSLSSFLSHLRPASFKGIEFKVDTSDLNSGRRNVVHEYPQKDQPFVEDLGRNTREIRVECWVIGDDYLMQRDALLNACESPESGELIHPYFGRRQVACTTVSVRQSAGENRLARFSMTFVESSNVVFPTTIIDTLSQLVNAANQVQHIQQDLFDLTFNTKSFQNHTAVIDLSQRLGFDLQNLPLQFDPNVSADFVRVLQNLNQPPFIYWHEPSLFSQTVVQGIQYIQQGSSTPASAIKYHSTLLNFGDALFSTSEQTKSFIDLVQITVLGEIAKSASDAVFQNREESVATRDQLIEYIDSFLEQCNDQNLFSALQGLRAQIIFSLPDQPDLPHLIQITPRATLPSLVLAYQLYADSNRADEIVSRNNIVHPGFIPGGNTLNVLSE